ncbi:MAG TPA: hypothetical protein H9871_01905 [Candidatus Nesterenkonia stercoripullorum]|uniref:Uncharacterized protein n=1 Tax=Candidatus Nesterenkonia stercoripullorum TaxID=2838701 RepID=A0A9D1S0Q1_9MICC|nr:hypothetical protein [Candidatus Nesterenkonia stercoripullorum]
MARRSFKQIVGTLAAAGILATGGLAIDAVKTTTEAQAAPCVAYQGTKYLTGYCDKPFTYTFKCVGIQGSWAYKYKKDTAFRIAKPCNIVYAQKIKTHPF